MNITETLNNMLLHGTTTEEAIELFDQLEAVQAKDMWWLWKGEEIKTEHPF